MILPSCKYRTKIQSLKCIKILRCNNFSTCLPITKCLNVHPNKLWSWHRFPFQSSAGDVWKTAYDYLPLIVARCQSLFIIVKWSHPQRNFETLIKTLYIKNYKNKKKTYVSPTSTWSRAHLLISQVILLFACSHAIQLSIWVEFEFKFDSTVDRFLLGSFLVSTLSTGLTAIWTNSPIAARSTYPKRKIYSNVCLLYKGCCNSIHGCGTAQRGVLNICITTNSGFTTHWLLFDFIFH